jgi:hypothetical protein
MNVNDDSTNTRGKKATCVGDVFPTGHVRIAVNIKLVQIVDLHHRVL